MVRVVGLLPNVDKLRKLNRTPVCNSEFDSSGLMSKFTIANCLKTE